METLIFYTYEFAASILPFSAAFIFLSHKQKKGGEKTHLLPGLLLFLFAVYIVCVYHVTGTGTLWDAFLYRFQTEISHINPIPFSAGIDMVGYILNIILFIPFGFLIPLIWKKMRSLHLTALAGFSFSILIEISQLLNNRRTDIDDLIMNTLGAIIGFLIYKSFKKLMPTRLHNKLNDFSYPVLELPLYIFILFAGRFFYLLFLTCYFYFLLIIMLIFTLHIHSDSGSAISTNLHTFLLIHALLPSEVPFLLWTHRSSMLQYRLHGAV